MNAAGIIFSNLHDNNITELTRQRTMASIPFACRYRFIDFPLSNMVNSGITNISVIARYNYHSLMDHIGTGKDWDLARRTSGIKILPPYITAYANASNNLYNTRLEALKSVIHSIRHIQEDLVVFSDSDIVCNIDVDELIKYHVDANADITMVVKNVPHDDIFTDTSVLIESDKDNQITDIYMSTPAVTGKVDACIYIWVMKKDLLLKVVSDAIAHGYTRFSQDIIAKNIGKLKMQVYRHTGFSATISSFNNYFHTSMELLKNDNVRDALFNVPSRPIFTKVRNSAPTKYVSGSNVSESLIADGCVIEGTVDNCILFRGVKIGKGAVVKNSILFQDTVISDNVYLNCVVTDKNAVIRDGRVLSGHETMPIYVEKGRLI
jgi:glucose-1-phosphate adenylyltransferase